MQEHAEAIDHDVTASPRSREKTGLKRHINDIHDRSRHRELGQIEIKGRLPSHAEASGIDEEAGIALDRAHLAPGMNRDPRRRCCEIAC